MAYDSWAPVATWTLGRSFVSMCVRSFVAKIFRRPENFGGTKILEKNWGRRDRFRPKIVEIGAMLAIFVPFEVRNFRTPFFGEFG